MHPLAVAPDPLRVPVVYLIFHSLVITMSQERSLIKCRYQVHSADVSPLYIWHAKSSRLTLEYRAASLALGEAAIGPCEAGGGVDCVI